MNASNAYRSNNHDFRIFSYMVTDISYLHHPFDQENANIIILA